MIVAVHLAAVSNMAYGQQFRQPALPGGSVLQDNQFNNQDSFSRTPAARTPSPLSQADRTPLGLAPSGAPQQDQRKGFAPPKSDGGLRTVPVRPRGNGSGISGGPYQPDELQGRTGEMERILEQIRSGNFEGNTGVGKARGQIIRRRYDNGKDQIVRHVKQDEDGNYFNHGPWRYYNRRGEQIASGQFANGAMDGTWERWHQANSGGLFSTQPFSQFQGPFLSTATFSEGELNGVWVITDRARRKIVEVSYQNGKRDGTAIWWFPEAKKMRVVNFKKGELNGPFFEWNEQQQLVHNEEFIQGRKVIQQTTSYRPQQKSAEEWYLDAKIELDGEDDWWLAEPAEFKQSGEKFQQGPSFAWYSNGQRKMAGQYWEGVRVGDFLWWHENGQRALAGRYEEGVKVGGWTWWHENGVKSIEGVYDSDQTIGKWTWWDEEGQVSNREDYGDGDDSTGELVEPFKEIQAPNPFGLKTDEVEEIDTDPDEIDLDEMGNDGNEIDLNPPDDVEILEEIRPDVTPDDQFMYEDVDL